MNAQSRQVAKAIKKLAVDAVFEGYPERWRRGLVVHLKSDRRHDFHGAICQLERMKAVKEHDLNWPEIHAKCDVLLHMFGTLEYAIDNWIQGFDPDVMETYPALELIREIHDEPDPTDWAEKWRDAGGHIYAGRMISLRGASVWQTISEFGMPFPPFSAEATMGVTEIALEEAMTLGLTEGQSSRPSSWTLDTEFFTKAVLAGVQRVVVCYGESERDEDEI